MNGNIKVIKPVVNNIILFFVETLIRGSTSVGKKAQTRKNNSIKLYKYRELKIPNWSFINTRNLSRYGKDIPLEKKQLYP